MAKVIKTAIIAAVTAAATVLILGPTGLGIAFGNASAAAGVVTFGNLTMWGAYALAAQYAAIAFVGTAIAGGIGMLTSRGVGAVGQNFGTKLTGKGAQVPRQIVYGQCKVGGTIVKMSTSGDDNNKLHLAIVLAGHEIESLEDIYFYDEDLATTTNTISGETVYKVTNARFVNDENENALDAGGTLVQYTFHDGSQTTVDGLASANLSARYPSSAKFQGMAYIYMELIYDPEKMAQIPPMSFVVKGKKVYDPRTSTTAFSSNPALIVRDYLVDTTYGLRATSSEINDATSAGGFAAAATACDVDVDLNESGTQTEKRFTANGFINAAGAGDGVLEGILSSCAGKVTYTNGKFNMFVGTAQTPTLTITDDDLLQAAQLSTKTGNGDLFNGIKALYVDSDDKYNSAEAPPLVDSTYLSEDTPTGEQSANYKKILETQLPFTTTHTMAQRLAKIQLKRQREGAVLSVLTSLEFMRLQPSDWVKVTNSRLSYSEKTFEVLSIQMEFGEAEGALFAATRLTLQEVSAATYDYAYSEYSTPQTIATRPEGGDLSVQAPTAGTITQRNRLEGATTKIDLVVPWTNHLDSAIQGTEVQYKESDESTYSTATVAARGQTQGVINNVNVGKAYNVRIRHFSYDNVFSSFVDYGAFTVSEPSTIDEPTNLTVSTDKPFIIQISYTNPTAENFRSVEVYYGTADDFTPASANLLGTYYGEPSKTKIVNVGRANGLSYNTDYYFKIRAVNQYGSASSYVTSGAAQLKKGTTVDLDSLSANLITTDQLAADRIDVAGVITAGSLLTDSATIGNDIRIGSGESVFSADSDGIYLGNETFANAEFRVTPAGAVTATSATITGTVTADTFTLSSGATLNDTDGQIDNEAIDTDFPLGVTYYWPCNSIATVDANGDEELQEVIAGKTGIHSGSTAPTISTDSPSGRSIVNGTNNSGWTLLSDTDADALETANGFAWSLWFKSDTTSGDSQARIIGRDASDGWAILIDQSATGNQAVTLYGEPSTESMGSLAQGEWHHFCLSEDGNGTISGYVNGELVSTESYTPVDSARPVVIGCNTEDVINTAASVFEGKLTEIRAYNRALTAKEVRSLYKNPTAGTPAKIDGDLIVSNSITATEINVSNLSSLAADLGTVTAGQLSISAGTTPSISGADPAGKGILLKSDGDVFFGDATATEEADKRYFFFDQSEGTVSVKGTLAPTSMDFSQVTDDTNVPANVKVNGYGDRSIGKDALSDEAYDEIARRVGNTGGFYATATGFYLGSTKNIAIASTQDHGTQDVRVTVSINDVFTYPRNWYAGDNALKITVKLFAKKATDSAYLSSHQIGTTQTFEATPTLLQYATRYTINESYQVVLASGTDIEDSTDYDFKVELTRVANPNAFKSSADGGANDTTGTPVTLEVAEGTISTAAAGNADTLDNLEATDFFRLGESGATIDNTAHGNQTFTGDVTITGALTITGNIDQYNVTDLDITDKTITVNSGGTQALSDGSGLIVDRGTAADASVTWNETSDEFTLSHPLQINRTTSGGELLHLYNTYDGGYRDDLLIENTNDRDAGITIKTTGGQYEMWVDSNGDDSLIFSAGDNTSNITMELYQNKNVDIGGNLDVTGEIDTSKGLTFNPNGFDINGDSDGNRTLFTFTRSGAASWQIWHNANQHLNFIPNNTSYKLQWNGNDLWSAADFTSTDTGNWDTAYTYSQVGHLPLAGGTLTGQLKIHTGAPVLELKDTTDDDDHHIYFKNNTDSVVYEIATQNATSGDALTFYSASQEIVHRIGSTNILEAHSGSVNAKKPLTTDGAITTQANSAGAGINIKRTNAGSGGSKGFIAFRDLNNDAVASIHSVASGGDNNGNLVFRTSAGAGTSDAYSLTTALTLDTSQNATFAGNVYALGTASNSQPRYTFSGDADTGLGYIGGNQVGLIAGGSRKFYVSTTSAYFQNLTGGVHLPRTTFAHSESSGMKLTATDSTANASFYGFHIDYNASGSDACTTDRIHAGLFIDADSSATGGLTNHEHRFYGAYVDARTSGDSDVVRGGYFQARVDDFGSGNQVSALRGLEGYTIPSQNAGIVSNTMGVYGFAQDSSSGSGQTQNTYGGYFNAYAASSSSSTGNAYIGVRSFAQISATQTADISQAVAVWGEVQLDNDSATDHDVTISSAFVFRAEYDENDSNDSYTVNTGYLYYGNYAGALPTTAWGVYIADAVENYFGGGVQVRGDLAVGSSSDASRYIKIDKATTGENGILFRNGGSNKIKILQDSSEHLRIYTNNTGLRMSILEGGQVTLNNTTNYTIGGTARLTIKDSSVLVSMGDSNSDLSYIRRESAGVYTWQTYNNGNTGQLRLEPYGGTVAIGATSPDTDSVLHVSGTDTSPSLNATTPASYTAIFSNSDPAYGMLFGVQGSGNGEIQQRRTNNATYYHLQLQPYGGRVGIGKGTTSPTQTLDVAGSIGISGTTVVDSSQNIYVPVAQKLYFGASSHTYISEDIDDRMRIYVGGEEFIRLTEGSSDSIGLYKATSITGGTLSVTGGNVDLRNNTAGDGATIRDINFMTTAAQGSDDRVAIIRAANHGGASDSRGGRLYFYTRKANNAGFNNMSMDANGNINMPAKVGIGTNTFTNASNSDALIVGSAFMASSAQLFVDGFSRFKGPIYISHDSTPANYFGISYANNKLTLSKAGSAQASIDAPDGYFIGTTKVIDSNRKFMPAMYAGSNFAISGTSTTANHVMTGAVLGHGAEDSHVTHPFLHNDLANFVARGGTVTFGGLNTTPDLNNAFKPNSKFMSLSSSNYTGSTFTITLTNLPKGLNYGGYTGISFGSASWAPASVKIETSTDGGSTWTTRLNAATKRTVYFASNNAGAASVNAIRFTIGQPTSSLRIMNIWAYNYDSHGMDNYFLDKAGGVLYGELQFNDGNTKLLEGGGNRIKVQTNSGYVEVGAGNTSHAHFITDRSNYYFDKEIRVDSGVIGSYDEDLYLRRASSSNNQIQIADGQIYASRPLEIKHEGGGSATTGGRFLNPSYAGSNRTSVFSSQYASGNLMIGNGMSYDSGANQIVSTFSNFSDVRTGVKVNRGGIVFTGTQTATNTAVDSVLSPVDTFNHSTQTGQTRIGSSTGTLNSFLEIKKADNNVSDHIQFFLGSTRMGEIGAHDTTWLRINQVTAKNIYTPRLFRADGGLQAGAGSASAAGFRFVSDSDTGMFRYGSNIIGFTAGGTRRMRVGSSVHVDTTDFRIQEYMYHEGDTDTYLRFETNRIRMVAGNSTHFDTDYTKLTTYTSGTVPITVGKLVLKSSGKTGWASGDEFGSIDFYNSDGSGIGARNAVRIVAENNQGNGSSTTTFEGELAFYTSPYNSQLNSNPALRLEHDNVARFYGQLKPSDGTSALPSYSFASDGNLGFYRYGSDVIAVSCGGTRRARFGSSIYLESNDVRINAYLYHNGDTDTHLRYETDRIIMKAGGVEMLDMVEGATDYVDIIDRVRVTGGGNLECEGNLIAYSTTSISDINQKENIRRIKNPIDKIKQISGYTFDWKTSGEQSGGVIAQEIEQVMPSVVKETSIRDGDKIKAVDYQAIIGLLVETVKDLNKRIEELENGNNEDD